MGEHKLSSDPDCGDPNTDPICNNSPQDFGIEEIIFHQDYGVPHVFRNDIALLRLSGPANFSGLLHTYNISNSIQEGREAIFMLSIFLSDKCKVLFAVTCKTNKPNTVHCFILY